MLAPRDRMLRATLFDPRLDAHQVRVLPSGVRARDISWRARHAGMTFLAGTAAGWTRSRLRSWLILEYGMATEWTHVPHVRPWLDPEARGSDEDVFRLTIDTRQSVV